MERGSCHDHHEIEIGERVIQCKDVVEKTDEVRK